jgi:hypothetical protein
MLRLLFSFAPANLVHQLGTGRALDNARRDHVELTLTMAEVDALVGRIAAGDRAVAANVAARSAA